MKKLIALAMVFGLTGCGAHGFIPNNVGQLIYNPNVKQYDRPKVEVEDPVTVGNRMIQADAHAQRYRDSDTVALSKEQRVKEHCLQATEIAFIRYVETTGKEPTQKQIANNYVQCIERLNKFN